MQDERRRRRRQRLRRRLARLGLRERRQQPDRRQRARHARRRHCCRNRQQRPRRRRRDVELTDHAAQVPGRRRLRHDRRCDQRDPLRSREGRSDPEQLVGRRRRLGGAPRRDRADRRERRALRGRRGERLHEHRCRAVLSGELRRAEHPRRRRERPARSEGLVLELRRADGRPLGAGDERLLDLARCDLSLRRRNLDGDAAGLGRRGAREGSVPERERRRPEGAPASRRGSDRCAQHGLADRRTAERRPRRQMRRHSASVDRIARQRDRGERGSAARDSRPRRVVRLAGRSLRQRDPERQPVPARRARRRPLLRDVRPAGRRGQPHSHGECGSRVRRPKRDRDGEPDLPDRPRRQSRHDHDALCRRERVAHVRRPGRTSGSRCA